MFGAGAFVSIQPDSIPRCPTKGFSFHNPIILNCSILQVTTRLPGEFLVARPLHPVQHRTILKFPMICHPINLITNSIFFLCQKCLCAHLQTLNRAHRFQHSPSSYHFLQLVTPHFFIIIDDFERSFPLPLQLVFTRSCFPQNQLSNLKLFQLRFLPRLLISLGHLGIGLLPR